MPQKQQLQVITVDPVKKVSIVDISWNISHFEIIGVTWSYFLYILHLSHTLCMYMRICIYYICTYMYGTYAHTRTHKWKPKLDETTHTMNFTVNESMQKQVIEFLLYLKPFPRNLQFNLIEHNVVMICIYLLWTSNYFFKCLHQTLWLFSYVHNRFSMSSLNFSWL